MRDRDMRRTRADGAVYTRRRLIAAGLALGAPAVVLAASRRRAPVAVLHAAGATIASATSPPTAPSTSLAPPTTLPPPPAPAPITAPSLDHTLSVGMNGDSKIAVLQDRLRELRFDPGPTDGFFGDATLRAVWAFEKLILGVERERVTGVVTPASWEVLHAPVDVRPRRPGIPGTHLEVYLPEQVAVLFRDGVATLVTHVSTGEGIEWCDEVTIDEDDGTQSVKAICGVSVTPGGVYHFERKVDGWRNAPLGRLYKPVYFNYGIAVHGATNVPARPASRGCVRIPMHIAEYFPDLVRIGDWVFVFDGVEEPEHYGAQLPVFDFPDPSATTTTTSTTTTTTTTSTTTTTTAPPVGPTSTPTTAHAHEQAPTTLPTTTVPPSPTPTTAPPVSSPPPTAAGS
jgi:hypothetical protein